MEKIIIVIALVFISLSMLAPIIRDYIRINIDQQKLFSIYSKLGNNMHKKYIEICEYKGEEPIQNASLQEIREHIKSMTKI